MADITLDDLLQWHLGYAHRSPAGAPAGSGLERPISWAVTIRAATPVLPPLRGGELVIAPPRLLQQLEAAESFSPRDLVAMLARQPITALLVAAEFSEAPVPGVTLLAPEGAFPHDAEAVLNRLLTERRAQLYNLGSDLSRALTTISMSGAGLDAVLAEAERITGRRLALLDAAGAALASSRPDASPPAPPLAALSELLASPGSAAQPRPLLLPPDDERWLAVAVRAPGRTVALVLGPATAGRGEVDRLALTQAAQSVELLLGQAGRAGPTRDDGANREALAAELLRGQLAPREAAEARARLLGLDPAEPARVALASWRGPGAGERLRDIATAGRPRAVARLGDGELAAIAPAGDAFDGLWRELNAAAARSADPTLRLVASDVVRGPALAAVALGQARALTRLARAGALPGAPVAVDARDPTTAGAYALLLPLLTVGEALTTQGERRLTDFAAAFLAPLEAHDAKRGGGLVETLDAWLRLGGAQADAAQALGVHRNTLAYRLGRIADLTGADLGDAQTRFLLQLALAARALGHAWSAGG